jgi:hypothetical protein
MAAILLFRQLATNQSVDGRDKPGHDDVKLRLAMARVRWLLPQWSADG